MNYLDNLMKQCQVINRKAFNYRDGRAWDNKKCKTARRHWPRGKAFRRLMRMENKAKWDALSARINSNVNAINELTASL